MSGKLDKFLPILQSSLPPLEKMIAYFGDIEKNRCHTNFGTLFRTFEARMADFLGVKSEEVAIVCNGTLALALGIMALDIPTQRYCLMPSWTFSATPAAAMLAGLQPYFLDVDVTTQTLTPHMVYEFLEHNSVAREQIGAVLVVSPFGKPIDRQAWDELTEATGIPVIIDAAASLDAVLHAPQMQPGLTPMMISLHATKILGIGEGGLLVSKQAALIQKVRGMSNFGFDVSRYSNFFGINAKITEYQAAIGLAVLDAWPDIRARRLQVTENYKTQMAKAGLSTWLSSQYLTSTCNILIPGKAAFIRDYLVSKNIEARIWWEHGCHSHKAYQAMPKLPHLPNTAYLSKTMLGIPYSIDTSPETITVIVNTIMAGLHEWAERTDRIEAPA